MSFRNLVPRIKDIVRAVRDMNKKAIVNLTILHRPRHFDPEPRKEPYQTIAPPYNRRRRQSIATTDRDLKHGMRGSSILGGGGDLT